MQHLPAPGLVRIGITDWAQQTVGDRIGVTPHAVGSDVQSQPTCADVESTAVVDVFSPVSGTVAACNDAAEQPPGTPQRRSLRPWMAGRRRSRPLHRRSRAVGPAHRRSPTHSSWQADNQYRGVRPTRAAHEDLDGRRTRRPPETTCTPPSPGCSPARPNR
ncbi:hypothetical protein ACGFY3_44455 [Streptomyces mirabilis]|uniref:hypothetical protein n=1 Tax=Streptomyces mirabilis TaxID=68239 RepID=UPI00371D98E9